MPRLSRCVLTLAHTYARNVTMRCTARNTVTPKSRHILRSNHERPRPAPNPRPPRAPVPALALKAAFPIPNARTRASTTGPKASRSTGAKSAKGVTTAASTRSPGLRTTAATPHDVRAARPAAPRLRRRTAAASRHTPPKSAATGLHTAAAADLVNCAPTDSCAMSGAKTVDCVNRYEARMDSLIDVCCSRNSMNGAHTDARIALAPGMCLYRS
mmetsp:Transcript_17396/g.43052  ORF Transcript_17396/g.43052 Transcript_17396/m.43052 type:complete len:214 (+) Transcript_17396:113-754(+)